MTHFSGALTQSQFSSAMRLMNGKQPNPRVMLATAMFFSLFAIMAGVALSPFAGGLVLLLFVLPSVWAWWSQSEIRFQRIFARNEGFQHFVNGSFDDNEIVYGARQTSWSSVTKVQHDAEILLLYTPVIFIIARSFFGSDDDWARLIARAHAVLAPTARNPSRAGAIVKSVLLWVIVIIGVFLLWSMTR